MKMNFKDIKIKILAICLVTFAGLSFGIYKYQQISNEQKIVETKKRIENRKYAYAYFIFRELITVCNAITEYEAKATTSSYSNQRILINLMISLEESINYITNLHIDDPEINDLISTICEAKENYKKYSYAQLKQNNLNWQTEYNLLKNPDALYSVQIEILENYKNLKTNKNHLEDCIHSFLVNYCCELTEEDKNELMSYISPFYTHILQKYNEELKKEKKSENVKMYDYEWWAKNIYGYMLEYLIVKK